VARRSATATTIEQGGRPGRDSSARYVFRALVPNMQQPIRKTSVLRDIRRVIAPYLEPGESIGTCAQFSSQPIASGGLLQVYTVIRRNRGRQVLYAAVTDRRVLMVEVSSYVKRPRGLVLSDPRQGASLRPLINPRIHRYQWSGNFWGAVEYRGPSGQERQLWYDGRFTDEVGRHLLGLGPEQKIERYRMDPLVRGFMISIALFCAAVVILAVVVPSCTPPPTAEDAPSAVSAVR
jgi:hypothetical protein